MSIVVTAFGFFCFPKSQKVMFGVFARISSTCRTRLAGSIGLFGRLGAFSSTIVGTSRVGTGFGVSSPMRIPVRFVTYGREYQPNTLKRKRSFGFLARLKSKTGRKILLRRMLKGRKYLTH